MPNIRDFQTPGLGLNPTETGIEAQAGAARRIGAFFNQASQSVDTLGQRVGGAIRDAGDAYVKYEDHRQISAGAAHGAAIINGLNQEWNDTAKNADPNDPSVAGKFREERLEPALAKFQEAFTTDNSQRWAESFIDRYRQHMFEKTAADMSGLAADALHVNTLKTNNELANTVYDDPHGLEFARNTWRETVNIVTGTSPNITGAQAAKVRTSLGFEGEQKLVRSAIEGAIAKGGDWQSLANDPKNKPFINGAEIEKFARDSKRQQNEERIQAAQVRQLQRQEAQATLNSGIANIKVNNEKFDEATGLTLTNPKAIPAYQALRAKLADTGIDLDKIDKEIAGINRSQKTETDARISRASQTELMRSLHEGKLEPDALLEMAWQARLKDAGQPGSMNERDFNTYRAEIEGRKTPEGLALSQDRNQFLHDFAYAIDGGRIGNTPSAAGVQEIAKVRDALLQREKELGPRAPELYRRSSELYFNKDGAATAKHAIDFNTATSYQFSIGSNQEIGATKEKPIVIPPTKKTEAQVRDYIKETNIKSGAFIKLPDGTIIKAP